MLYRQNNRRFDWEYWARLEKNQRKWKEGYKKRKRTLEIIKEEDKEKGIEKEKSRIEEQEKEDEMGNLWDPYDKL